MRLYNRLVAIFIIISTCSISSAQGVFFIETEVTPFYSSSTFKNISEDFNITSNQTPKIGWDASLMLGKEIKSDFFIKGGIEIANRGYYTGVANADSNTIGKLNRYAYSFPVKVGKRFTLENLILEPCIGIKYERLAGIAILAFDTASSVWFNDVPADSWNKNLLYALVSIEAIIDVKKSLSIVVGPQFDFALNNEFWNKDAILKKHLYSIGINIGLRFNITSPNTRYN